MSVENETELDTVETADIEMSEVEMSEVETADADETQTVEAATAAAAEAEDAEGDDVVSAPLDPELLRLVEAILFAAVEPLDEASIAARLPEDADIRALLADLQAHYAERGVNLIRVAKKWALRTAPDLGDKLLVEREATRRLSRAAIETLAIIAYHQPITRGEVENIRGVAVNKGTLDVLLEAGWIKPGRRREVPGRPVTWLTNDGFLDHFGLESLKDLPGVKELKAAGLLDTRPAINVYSERANDEDGDLGDEGVVPDGDTEPVEPLASEDAPAA